MESVMKSISENQFMIWTLQNPIGNMSAICWESGSPHRLNQWRPYTFWGDDLRFHLILIENKNVDIKFSVHDAFLDITVIRYVITFIRYVITVIRYVITVIRYVRTVIRYVITFIRYVITFIRYGESRKIGKINNFKILGSNKT